MRSNRLHVSAVTVAAMASLASFSAAPESSRAEEGSVASPKFGPDADRVLRYAPCPVTHAPAR
jgi:hypothetical protein